MIWAHQRGRRRPWRRGQGAGIGVDQTKGWKERWKGERLQAVEIDGWMVL